jgi:hypothetical protein
MLGYANVGFLQLMSGWLEKDRHLKNVTEFFAGSPFPQRPANIDLLFGK